MLNLFSFAKALLLALNSLQRKCLIYFILFFTVPAESFSQLPATKWIFGENAGLDFLAPMPTPIPLSAINSEHGSTSLASGAGNLLLYSDGMSVFDSNHSIMPNGSGLNGSNLASQSSLAIPMPGNSNLVYLFTVAAGANPEGIQYSVIDLSLNSGLGDVIMGQKNIALLSPATEKISAVNHCNGSDVWILGHEWMSNRFFAWLLTPIGLSAPVISSVGSNHNLSTSGCMKFSNNGGKLAIVCGDQNGSSFIEIFDFDASSGTVSNPLLKQINGVAHGTEFSNKCQYVYYSFVDGNNPNRSRIMQMDVCAGTAADILSSEREVGLLNGEVIGSIQAAARGRIFFARKDNSWLGLIPLGDNQAPFCGFVPQGADLGSGISKYGLPLFNQSLVRSFSRSLDVQLGCRSVDVSLESLINQTSCSNEIQQVTWDFGEPSSGPLNSSTSFNASHVYASDGDYTITAFLEYSCGYDTITEVSAIDCGLTINAESFTICEGECAVLNATVSGGVPPFSYSWSNLPDTSPGPISVCPSTSTAYIVSVTDAGGNTSSTSLNVIVVSVPNPNVIIDSVTCFGLSDGKVYLSYPQNNYFCEWLTLGPYSGYQREGLPAGIYDVTITNSLGCQTDVQLEVEQPDLLTYTLSSDSSNCGQNTGAVSISLQGGTTPYSYLWNNPSAGTNSTLTSLTPGVYSVEASDSKGCSVTDSIEVFNFSPPQISGIDTSDVSCFQVDDGGVLITVSGGELPYVVTWSDAGSGLQRSDLIAGTYTYEITDAHNCSVSGGFDIEQPEAITFSESVNPPGCYGLTDGSIEIIPSGGIGPYQVDWQDGFNGAFRDGLLSQMYVFTITDFNSCSLIDSVLISQPDSISGVLSSSPSVCNSPSGEAEILVSGGTMPYFYLWSNGDQTSNALNLDAGSVSVLITDAQGCQKSFETLVQQQPAALLLIVETSSISCNGFSDGALELQASSPVSVEWNTGSSNLQVSNLATGLYSVFTLDGGGCRDTLAYQLNEPTEILTLGVSSPATCSAADGTAEISVSGGQAPYIVTWSNGASGLVNSNIIAGNYSYTVIDDLGCSLSNQVVVASNGLLIIDTIIVSSASCFGFDDGIAEAQVSGNNGAISYNWSNGSTDANAIDLFAGSYSLSVSDASGCSAFRLYVVDEPDSVEISFLTNDASCFNLSDGSATAIVSGGTAPYTFNWDGSLGSNFSNLLTAGIYNLTVVDNSGCIKSSNFEIDEPEELQVQFDITNPSCGQANGAIETNAVGGSSPYSFSWTMGASSANLNGLQSGTFSLSVGDANGCLLDSIVELTDIGIPQLDSIRLSDVSCYNGSDGSIAVFVSGGSGSLQYLWSNGQTESFVEDLSIGQYSVSVIDSMGCELIEEMQIEEPEPILIDLETALVSCFGGTNGSAVISAEGGVSPYSFQVLETGTLMNMNQLQLGAGNYIARVDDNNSCIQDLAFEILEPSPLVLEIATSDASCSESASGLAQAFATGGISPYSYNWSDGSTGSIADSLFAGFYTLEVSDAVNCLIQSSIEILAPQPVLVQITGSEVACYQSQILLQSNVQGGTGDYTYEWLGGIDQESADFVADTTMIITLNVFDENMCAGLDSFNLLVIQPPLVEISSDSTELCAGDCIEVEAVTISGGSYIWKTDFEAVSGELASLCFSDSGLFDLSLTVIDAFGCTQERFFEDYFTVHSLPIADFTTSASSLPVHTSIFHFGNTSQNADEYVWDFDSSIEDDESTDFSPSYQYTEPGQYEITLTAINEFGCEDQTVKQIEVTNDFLVFVPNAFTPNSDGLNDVFLPVVSGVESSDYLLRISDRWGNILFTTDSISEGWDGSNYKFQETKRTASGVYVWELSVKTDDDEMHLYNGRVTLVR